MKKLIIVASILICMSTLFYYLYKEYYYPPVYYVIKGATEYHKEKCPLLKKMPYSNYSIVTKEYTARNELSPCKVCRPSYDTKYVLEIRKIKEKEELDKNYELFLSSKLTDETKQNDLVAYGYVTQEQVNSFREKQNIDRIEKIVIPGIIRKLNGSVLFTTKIDSKYATEREIIEGMYLRPGDVEYIKKYHPEIDIDKFLSMK